MCKLSVILAAIILAVLVCPFEAFYLGNFYANAPYTYGDMYPPMRDSYVIPEFRRTERDLSPAILKEQFQSKDAQSQPKSTDKKSIAPDSKLMIKRFRPCYYSPIQCLIKRK